MITMAKGNLKLSRQPRPPLALAEQEMLTRVRCNRVVIINGFTHLKPEPYAAPRRPTESEFHLIGSLMGRGLVDTELGNRETVRYVLTRKGDVIETEYSRARRAPEYIPFPWEWEIVS